VARGPAFGGDRHQAAVVRGRLDRVRARTARAEAAAHRGNPERAGAAGPFR